MVFAQYSKSIATLHVGKGWELCYLLWHSAKKKNEVTKKKRALGISMRGSREEWPGGGVLIGSNLF